MGILSRINAWLEEDCRKAFEAEMVADSRFARLLAQQPWTQPHDELPWAEWMSHSPVCPPRCRPSCPRCAYDAEQARKAAVRRERHVPDPHYGDWGA
jgi:hypothetical protein